MSKISHTRIATAFILILINTFFLFITTAHAQDFSLTSDSISEISTIDKTYTCDGKNISPALAWNHAPAQTVSFALILSDPDAPGGTFYHWVLFNIPKTTSSLAENISQLPSGTQTGINSFGKTQYNGPCPPKGKEHQYIFRLYALDATLDIPDHSDANAVMSAMQNHVLDVTEIKSTFGH